MPTSAEGPSSRKTSSLRRITLGAETQFCTKMVREIWAAAGRHGEPDLADLAVMFAEGNVDTVVMETLSKGFDALLSRDGS